VVIRVSVSVTEAVCLGSYGKDREGSRLWIVSGLGMKRGVECADAFFTEGQQTAATPL
jgi:hypothetical protein